MADCASRMVPPPMVPTSMEGMETDIWRLSLLLIEWLALRVRRGVSGDLLLHDCDTIAALDDLCRILACSEEDRGDNIRCVSVEAADAAGHGAAY